MSLNNPQRIYTNTNALNISTLQHPNVRINVDKTPLRKKNKEKTPRRLFTYLNQEVQVLKTKQVINNIIKTSFMDKLVRFCAEWDTSNKKKKIIRKFDNLPNYKN